MATTTRKPSPFNDACCWGPRRNDELLDDYPNALDTAEALEVLQFNVTGLVTLLVFQSVLYLLWENLDAVPGFTRFDGAATEFSAIYRGMWWRSLEFITIIIGYCSCWWGLHYSRNGRIEKGVAGMRSFLVFYAVVLILGLISSVLLAIFMGLEWGYCTSTLCISYVGFLITFFFITIALALIKAWLLYRALVYRRNIEIILGAGKGSFEMSEPAEDVETTKMRIIGAQLKTPLLQKHARKFRHN